MELHETIALIDLFNRTIDTSVRDELKKMILADLEFRNRSK